MQFTEQLKILRRDDEFNEIDLNHLKRQLTQIQKELHQPPTILIQEDSFSSFINKISVQSSLEQIKWKQNATTIAGGKGFGNQLNQLYSPNGILIDHNHTIYIAGGHAEGNRLDQLKYPVDVCVDQQNNALIIADWANSRVIRCSIQDPRNHQILFSDIDCDGVTMDKNGSVYVSDYAKNEVKRWKKGKTEGTIVAGGNRQRDQLNQLNRPIHLFVDEDESIYVSDLKNHRVMKWRKDAGEGIFVAGGHDHGNDLNQLSSPLGVIVDHLGQIYVVDNDNHRVMRWCEGCEEGEVLVGGDGSNQLNGPIGLSFDVDGNLYVSDAGNHQIQKFEIDLKTFS